MNELYTLVEELNDLIYDENDVNNFYFAFVFETDGCDDSVSLYIDNSKIDVFNANILEREWDDEKDDYLNTPKEEIINQLERFNKRLNKIINKLKE